MWVSISNKYEVSDLGCIRNKKTKRVLRQFVGKDGYMRTQFDGKTRTVHRVVATAFLHPVPGLDFVNHKDGNKQNNAASNLEWCNRKENMCHAYNMGLKKPPRGMMNGRSILTYADVSFIRKYYIPRDKVFGAKALSQKFGVAMQTICAVASGQNWK